MRRTLALLLWLFGDALLFVGSYVLAYFLRVGWILSTDFPFDRFVTIVVAVCPFLLLTLIFTRTFGLTRTQASLRNLGYIIYANIFATAFFALGYFFVYGHFFSRLLLLQAFAISTIALTIWHIIAGRVQRHLLRVGRPVFPTLLIGVTRETRSLLTLLRERKSPIVPVAILDVSGVKDASIEGVPVLGKLNKLEDVLKEFSISHLIQCSDLEQSINLLSACRAHGITYMLLPSVLGIVERDERIESLEGKAVTVVSPEAGWWTWFFR